MPGFVEHYTAFSQTVYVRFSLLYETEITLNMQFWQLGAPRFCQIYISAFHDIKPNI